MLQTGILELNLAGHFLIFIKIYGAYNYLTLARISQGKPLLKNFAFSYLHTFIYCGIIFIVTHFV